MRHVISALVVNEPGVLANVAGMFAAHGFNIDSLVVGRTEDANLSRMTIVVDADENTLEQVRKQLAKLVPVTKVKDFKGTAYIERDLALITVSAAPDLRGEVIEIVNLFRGKVVDVSRDSLTVELAGTEENRSLRGADVPLWHPRARPHGRDRNGARHAARQIRRRRFRPKGATRSLNAPAAPALPPS